MCGVTACFRTEIMFRNVYQVVIHQKMMKMNYSINGRKIRANFCFSSDRPMSGVSQRPSGDLGTPECQVDMPPYFQLFSSPELRSSEWKFQDPLVIIPLNSLKIRAYFWRF